MHHLHKLYSMSAREIFGMCSAETPTLINNGMRDKDEKIKNKKKKEKTEGLWSSPVWRCCLSTITFDQAEKWMQHGWSRSHENEFGFIQWGGEEARAESYGWRKRPTDRQRDGNKYINKSEDESETEWLCIIHLRFHNREFIRENRIGVWLNDDPQGCFSSHFFWNHSAVRHWNYGMTWDLTLLLVQWSR